MCGGDIRPRRPVFRPNMGLSSIVIRSPPDRWWLGPHAQPWIGICTSAGQSLCRFASEHVALGLDLRASIVVDQPETLLAAGARRSTLMAAYSRKMVQWRSSRYCNCARTNSRIPKGSSSGSRQQRTGIRGHDPDVSAGRPATSSRPGTLEPLAMTRPMKSNSNASAIAPARISRSALPAPLSTGGSSASVV